MELNRDDIIKALECCTRGRKSKEDIPCLDCPYNECNVVGGTSERQIKGTCQGWIMKDALALITSQEQRIKELTEENERLRAEYEKAQIFSVFPKEEELKYLNALEQMAKECKTVRADTVMKMQSEIKERCIKGGIYPAFVKSTIDQIAEEIIGDAKQ